VYIIVENYFMFI